MLAALNPAHAVAFLATHGRLGFLALGAVVLAVTGAEALYADMGHFGRNPIRLAWFALVLPALVLNYFGQGALLIGDPAAVANPFYLLAPAWALYPMVALATMATIIASQAVISGAFSITRQAMQLGYAPRMEVQHTSGEQIGQIYLPGINWTLFAGVVALVLGFGTSSNLAAAYGIAVTGTMVITTVLALRRRPLAVEVAAVEERRPVRRLPLRRPRLLRRQRGEDRRRRLVPAGVRARRVPADVDLEARPRPAQFTAGGRFAAARRLRRERVAGLQHGPGRGGLPDHEHAARCRTRCCTA